MDITEKSVCEPKLSHISLCFGYGGIDLGLDRVFGETLRLAAVCEIESFAVENAIAKMEGGLLPAAPIWNDLRTFPWEEFQGVSLVSGGFPCQPFSHAGSRGADSDPRHLFPHILRGIGICRPSLVFLENVEGIMSAKLTGDDWRDPAGTPVLLHVLRELERVGYKAAAGIFSASETGAPHQRKRIFILAHRNESGWETVWNNAITSCRRLTHEAPAHLRDQGSSELADREKHGLQRALHAEDQSGSERGQGLPTAGGDCEGGQLADTAGGRLQQCEPERQPKGDACLPSQQELELAYAGSLNHGDLGGEGSSLLDGAASSKDCSVGAHGVAGFGEVGSSPWLWPSRPGQPQFWWEPPRVVDSENGGWPADHTPPGTERWRSAELGLADGEAGNDFAAAVGNPPLGQDDGRKPRDVAGAAREGRCGDYAPNAPSQGGLENPASARSGRESGDTVHERRFAGKTGTESIQEDSEGRDGASIADHQPTSGDGSRKEQEIAPLAALGRDLDGASSRVVVSELPRLSHEELVEIHQWMVLNTNRNDELRMLGNGVVAQTCEIAFLTLFNELSADYNNPIT